MNWWKTSHSYICRGLYRKSVSYIKVAKKLKNNDKASSSYCKLYCILSLSYPTTSLLAWSYTCYFLFLFERLGLSLVYSLPSGNLGFRSLEVCGLGSSASGNGSGWLVVVVGTWYFIRVFSIIFESRSRTELFKMSFPTWSFGIHSNVDCPASKHFKTTASTHFGCWSLLGS